MSRTLLPLVQTASPRRAITAAVDLLREQLPPSWSIDLEFEPTRPRTPWLPDAVITITALAARRPARLIAAFKSDLKPRDATDLARRLESYSREHPEAKGLVVAPWGSRRTRDVLRDLGIGFVDLTGNIDLILDDPTLVVRIDGADKNPLKGPSASPSLRGPKAWALMKTLIEVSPPYGVRKLAGAVGTDPGYTSRVLRVLEEERLVVRERRGPITEVDWPGLLSQLTATYGLFDANETSRWITGRSLRAIPDKLAAAHLERPWTITGSLAAVLIAPVAAPALAVVYADDPDEVAESLGLLPADSGANVVLTRPYDEAALARHWESDGAFYVSPAQIAADCLTGSGRMPAEGKALVEWMRSNEDRWRASGFDASPNPLE